MYAQIENISRRVIFNFSLFLAEFGLRKSLSETSQLDCENVFHVKLDCQSVFHRQRIGFRKCLSRTDHGKVFLRDEILL